VSITVNNTTVLRTSEDEPNWWGRPTVEVVNGVVVMVYYNTTQHGVNAGALHIKFSDDYGASWSDEDKTLEGADVTNFPMNPPDCTEGQDANEPWLYLAPNGNLLLHMWRRENGAVLPAVELNGMYQSISSDGGETWSVPAVIDFVDIADDTVIVTTDDHFVYDGVIYACGRNADGNITLLVKSEDNGGTWTHIANVTTSTTEIGMEYLGDNNIHAVLRTSSNISAKRALSDDMGETWTIVDIGHIIGNSGRHHIWTKAHLEGDAVWWTDSYLIMCGFIFVTANSRRNCLWFSKDGGINWSEPYYVDDPFDDGGYGDLFYNPNTGEYVFMCYRGTQFKADLVQYNISVNWGS
jgi:hypothetical protein